MIGEMWKKAMEFHGHGCPGLAVGFKVCEAVLGSPNLGKVPYGELMCVTENDACGADAVQCLLGCSFGKGNLVFKDVGKSAFTFFPPDGGPGLRIMLKPKSFSEAGSMEDRMAGILATPLDVLFSSKAVESLSPEPAQCLPTIVCEECGEGAAESRIRLQGGRRLCLDCFKPYDRRW